MSEQAKKVKNKNIPEWAQGLYYNSGLMSEVLVYYDEESIYFEHKGKESGRLREREAVLNELSQPESAGVHERKQKYHDDRRKLLSG